MNVGILDSVGPEDQQTKAQWFTKPLRGVLGGHSITFSDGQAVLNHKIFSLWQRIVVGILLIPGLLFYTIPAVIVLFLTRPDKAYAQEVLKTRHVVVPKFGRELSGEFSSQEALKANHAAEPELEEELSSKPLPNVKELPAELSAQEHLEIEPDKPLSIDNLLCFLQPQMGAKAAGGKEIQKVILFNKWLDLEYKNKESPTYKAYQSLIQSENLSAALFIGIRGDGDCGFRAMIVSMFLELVADHACKNKFHTLIERLENSVKTYRHALAGFDNLNSQCLQELKSCNGSPEQLTKLMNDDRFIGDLTRIFRFLSNAICAQESNTLPEAVRTQLEFGEGAQELGGIAPFLQAHANLDVTNVNNIKPYLFAGVTQIWVLAKQLGIGYWMGIVDEGQVKPQEPNICVSQNSLLILNLLCRDTRHFDVFHRNK